MTKIIRLVDWLEYERTHFLPVNPDAVKWFVPFEVSEELWQRYQAAEAALEAAQEALRPIVGELEAVRSDYLRSQSLRQEMLKSNSLRSKEAYLAAQGWTKVDISDFSKDGKTLKMHEAVELELRASEGAHDQSAGRFDPTGIG